MLNIENIYKNPNIYIEKISTETYPKNVIKNIKLISIKKDILATPFGSYTYRIQKYPGDVDLHEELEAENIEDLQNKFVSSFKKIVKNVINEKNTYFSEVKAGEDVRYNIFIGKMYSGNWIPQNFEKISELYENKLINKLDFEILYGCYFNPSQNNYDVAFNILRKYRVLRWTGDEVVKGVKNLPGNKKISLKEAIIMKSHVKIDIITIINDKFVEVTNFYILGIEKDDHYIPINLNFNFKDLNERFQFADYQLKEAIEKLYYSNMFYNPFKMVKRVYALARMLRDFGTIKKIYNLVTENISFLYQQKSELEAMIIAIENSKKFPLKEIQNNCSNMKVNLSRIIELPNEELDFLIKHLNDIIKSKDPKYIEEDLKKIKKRIQIILNYLTIKEMINIQFNPPPNDYLPNEPKYNRNIFRMPGSKQIDLIKQVQELLS